MCTTAEKSDGATSPRVTVKISDPYAGISDYGDLAFKDPGLWSITSPDHWVIMLEKVSSYLNHCRRHCEAPAWGISVNELGEENFRVIQDTSNEEAWTRQLFPAPNGRRTLIEVAGSKNRLLVANVEKADSHFGNIPNPNVVFVPVPGAITSCEDAEMWARKYSDEWLELTTVSDAGEDDHE